MLSRVTHLHCRSAGVIIVSGLSRVKSRHGFLQKPRRRHAHSQRLTCRLSSKPLTEAQIPQETTRTATSETAFEERANTARTDDPQIAVGVGSNLACHRGSLVVTWNWSVVIALLGAAVAALWSAYRLGTIRGRRLSSQLPESATPQHADPTERPAVAVPVPKSAPSVEGPASMHAENSEPAEAEKMLNPESPIPSPAPAVAVFWDIENCQVPQAADPARVASNIMELLLQWEQPGPITHFAAYGDFQLANKELRLALQGTGITLVDVPSGRKDAADKALLVDLFTLALKTPAPAAVLIITGDRDFSLALTRLRQLGYTVGLCAPFLGVCPHLLAHFLLLLPSTWVSLHCWGMQDSSHFFSIIDFFWDVRCDQSALRMGARCFAGRQM
ncbi:hypothetical protein CYMTET_39532 [Cymbomonas tetramitiformis]|uniref:NYN domain-containing protein n=1 Tax=Cymbomonas tetramitiformis TaxID=36881 RepID=A0AAE0F4K3_9CHLO|nr:hypothetical protein CYMTET_39532 [Cymbomonas tetramitiformis]